MKKIYNIVLVILLFSIILIVYFNIDKIVIYSKKFFKADKTIYLKQENNYKREYSLSRYKNYTTKEQYVPSNKFDLEEIIYNVLNNGWSTFTFYCPDEYTTCENDMEELSNNKVTLSGISNYVSPYNSYKNLNTKMYVDGKIELVIEKNYTDEEITKVNDEIKLLTTSLKLDNYSAKDKIIKLHNYLLNNSKYDKTRSETGVSSYSSNKAVGTLLEHYSICSGYSDSLSLFLDRFDIPNIKIASDKHVWNYVYIDGSWYHVDLTWDLPSESSDKISDTFLLITNKELEKLDTTEHSYDKTFYIEAK